MKIDKLKKTAAALNDRLDAAARGQSLATVNLLQAQIEFNNAVLATISDTQQQMEKLAAAARDRQADRPS